METEKQKKIKKNNQTNFVIASADRAIKDSTYRTDTHRHAGILRSILPLPLRMKQQQHQQRQQQCEQIIDA